MADNLFKISTIICAALTLCSCDPSQNATLTPTKETACSDACTAKSKLTKMSCKLTTPELRQRKATVIASLKKQVMEQKELNNGFAFKFKGTDTVLDELTAFIKTERACCDFFTFAIAVSGDKSETWLQLTGSNGVKEFITAELGLTD